MRKKPITFFLLFLLLSNLTTPSIACPPPDCGSCCYWISTGPGPNDGYCELMPGADCGDCAGCSPCYSCVDCFCLWDCTNPFATCCNGTCCDNPCCGNECCGANQYCCGNPPWNELCCNSDEVCCWYIDGSGNFVFYCNPPCTDAVTDTMTCNEYNEECFKCTDCKQISPPPTCSTTTYRDYTGLEISTCYDGCPQFDHNTSNETCYEVKNCFPMLHEDHLCLECEGWNICVEVVEFGDPPVCETVGQCVVQIACNIIFLCFQCTEGTQVLETIKEETCQCN